MPAWISAVTAFSITSFIRLITGAQARWVGCEPARNVRIYFANHSSHGDFALLWAVLPPALRRATRPVAGADYWGQGKLRRYLINEVFNGVLVERTAEKSAADPLAPLENALRSGYSLIFFPEGTRNLTEEPLLPLKSGLYRLALRLPEVELVPVWLENLNRVLPKGELLPLPLLCAVNFGAPLRAQPGEDKTQFLSRARQALLDLSDRFHHV